MDYTLRTMPDTVNLYTQMIADLQTLEQADRANPQQDFRLDFDLNDASVLIADKPAIMPQSSLSRVSINAEEEKTIIAFPHLVVPNPIISKQLSGLVTLCERFSQSRSQQDLLQLSWGVIALPKGRKFSSSWLSIIPEYFWLLLEDISRQLASGDPVQTANILDSIKELKAAFEQLNKIEKGEMPDQNALGFKQFPLDGIEKAFSLQFDRFILDQIARYIDAVKAAASDSQDITHWLQADPRHFKALFRLVEVIGEASKIISLQTRKQLPFLEMKDSIKKEDPPKDSEGNHKPIWTKLRNQLHHNKKRCWDVAEMAPERWADLWIECIGPLGDQISCFRQKKPNQNCPNATHIEKLKELIRLCAEEHYREVRQIWGQMKDNFHIEPLKLKRILFGLEREKPENLWVIANPFVREGNEEKTKCKIFEMVRRGANNQIVDEDIEALAKATDSIQFSDKREVIEKMKRLLQEISPNKSAKESEELSREYERLANQLVFIKFIKSKKKEKPEFDADKVRDLCKIVSWKISRLSRFTASITLFLEQGENSLAKELSDYIDNKCVMIKALIQGMEESLDAIEDSWSEKEILSAASLQSQVAKIKKIAPKDVVIKNYQVLKDQEPFIQLPDVDWNTLCKNLKFHHVQNVDHRKNQRAVQSLEDFNKDKDKCIRSVQELRRFLHGISYEKSGINENIITQINRTFQLLAEIEADEIPQNSSREEVNKIFKQLAFPPGKLNDFRQKMLNRMNSFFEDDVRKLDEIAQKAESETRIAYVQKNLRTNPRDSEIALLETIYLRNEHQQKRMCTAWNNIKRKSSGYRLSMEDMDKLESWFPTGEINEEQKKLKKQLFNYLNGSTDFDLKEFSRFEHGIKKTELFMKFLDDHFFPQFPTLKSRKEEIIHDFKIGNRIVDDSDKTDRFLKLFSKRVKSLGCDYEAMLNQEDLENPTEQTHPMQMAAEYDIQEIGEIAQLITDKSMLLRKEAHILSPQHLHQISMLRKMMAHYPLMLSSDVLHWHLEYLALDTRLELSNDRDMQAMHATDLLKNRSLSRRFITLEVFEGKIEEILENCDRLNLDREVHVLYPSFALETPDYLHPMGDLVLLVYPLSHLQTSQAEGSIRTYIRSLMELELMLGFEFNTKVTVIGEWENKLVNIPYNQHMPKKDIDQLMQSKQAYNCWMTSHRAFEAFSTQPWSSVIFNSKFEVTRRNFNDYHALTSFFRFLGLDGNINKEDLRRFLKQDSLFYCIADKLAKALEDVNKHKNDYSQSELFQWISCLFEKFCPPNTKPGSTICLPSHDLGSDLHLCLADSYRNTLRALPQHQEDVKDRNPHTQFYYKKGLRLDYFNGRSILDPDNPISKHEIRELAGYTTTVLTYHIEDIIRKHDPRYSLDRIQFKDVVSVVINGADELDEPKTLEKIDDKILEFINEEANHIGDRIGNLVSDMVETFGRECCVAMLLWLEVDKQIEVLARSYYVEHYARLIRPHRILDETSREFFEVHMHSKLFERRDFDFVSCFRVFLLRIFDETESFKFAPYPNVIGEFSDRFKILVPDREIQYRLAKLMKRRELRMMNALIVFRRQNAFFTNAQLNAIYFNWDALFRMVVHPNLFTSLALSVKKGEKEEVVVQMAQKEVEEDLKKQYCHPCSKIEPCLAIAQKDTHDMIKLWDPRTYFDVKNNGYEFSKRSLQLSKLEKEELIRFQVEWSTLYHEDSICLFYHANLIEEAAITLETLLNNRRLPKYELVDGSYGKYWDFVHGQDVRMESVWNRSQNMTSAKGYVLHKRGTFSELLKDKQIKIILEKNQRYHYLLKAYIDFIPLQRALVDEYYFLESQLNSYKKWKNRILLEQTHDWITSICKSRMDYIFRRLKTRHAKLQNKRWEIEKSTFFSMLRFSVNLKLVLDGAGNPSKEELGSLLWDQMLNVNKTTIDAIKEIETL